MPLSAEQVILRYSIIEPEPIEQASLIPIQPPHHRRLYAGTVYLRMMGRAVPATYGPTADVQWEGADATHTVDAAGRK